MLLFEIKLEKEISSKEGNKTSTIRIDINIDTLTNRIFMTLSEDYAIFDDIDPETASIDIEEIVPFLVSTRHQYCDMTEEYSARATLH